jgi:hypothetical protein
MQGGIHVYHLLHSYLYQWPLLLVCLLTLLPTIFCHGVRYVYTLPTVYRPVTCLYLGDLT